MPLPVECLAKDKITNFGEMAARIVYESRTSVALSFASTVRHIHGHIMKLLMDFRHEIGSSRPKPLIFFRKTLTFSFVPRLQPAALPSRGFSDSELNACTSDPPPSRVRPDRNSRIALRTVLVRTSAVKTVRRVVGDAYL